MAIQIRWMTQSCRECGNRLLKRPEGTIEIGSPLVACKRCGKISYTNLQKEWYNHPNKAQLWCIPLGMAVGIGIIMCYKYNPLALLLGGLMLVIAIASGTIDAMRIVRSKRRMRNPEYLAELLSWSIISQEEYEAFMRAVQQNKG